MIRTRADQACAPVEVTVFEFRADEGVSGEDVGFYAHLHGAAGPIGEPHGPFPSEIEARCEAIARFVFRCPALGATPSAQV